MELLVLVSLIDNKNLGSVEDEIDCQSLAEIAAVLTQYSWAPGVFSNRRRLIANLSRIELLVLDIDSGCSLHDAREKFKEYKHIIATSRNHQKEKNGVVCDRFRVVLFLSTPIHSDKDFKATWNHIYNSYPFIDEACKDASRFFFPSPVVVSINASGKTIEVVKHVEPILKSSTNILKSSTKGELWKSTLEFLSLGAPAGTRHNRLVQAVGNMREQGYSIDEVFEMVEQMTHLTTADWTQPGLNDLDRKTIERMFNREMKYEFKEKEEKESLFVKADELLTETFEYLTDKDKVKGEPTSIEGLDKLLGGGFRTGELTVLMAQAKTGKNTFYHYLMYKHLQRGIPFGYASRELNPATEVIPNLLSIATGNNAWKAEINDGFRRLSSSVLSAWPLYFAPGYGHFKLEEIEKWFITLKSIGVNHFLFDHFHYALEKEDYDSTASLIKQLKTITKKLDIHLNLIVQPRSLREGESLSLATLRGGAAIGQALDNLFILERVRDQDNVSKLTLEVARHKLAKLGSIYLKYDPDSTTLEEVARELIQEPPRIPQGAQYNRFGRPNYYAD
jgi:hypothetical protein